MSRPRILSVAVFALKAWDTAPRGKPAHRANDGVAEKSALEGMTPPPTQPID